MQFSSDGNTQSIVVQSNTTWTVAVTGGEGWLTVTPASGSNDGTISVTASENSATSDRSATITITWKDGTGTQRDDKIVVTQSKPGDQLSVSNNRIEFSAAGNELKFIIESNTSWEISVDYAGNISDWLRIDPLDGSNNCEITVRATENTSSSNRYATIIVNWSGAQENIQVSQNRQGETLSVDRNSISFSSEPVKPLPFNITNCNTSWFIEIKGGKGGDDWLEVTPMSGSFDREIIITAKKNETGQERDASVYVNWSGGREEIKVKQSNLNEQFEVTPDTSLIFNNTRSSLSFPVQYNVSWILEVEASWLSASQTQSKDESGSITVILTAEENPNIGPRSANIIFKQIGGSLGQSYPFEVIQRGKATLKLKKDGTLIDNQVIPFTVADSLFQFDIETKTKGWKVKSDKSWLEVVDGYTSGDENGTSKLYAHFNDTDVERKAIVSVEWNDDLNNRVSTTFTIIQDRCPVVPTVLELKDGIDVSKGVESTIGNPVELAINSSDFDNKDKWLFRWSVNGEKQDGNTSNVLNYAKLNEKKEYNVEVEIFYEDDPDNELLKQKMTFYLYPSPKIPTGLEVKGNGISGIMIASVNGVSDQQLKNDGYKFVFGYVDGDTLTVGTTSNRYLKYPDNSIVKNDNVNKWVYTQWDVPTRNGGSRTVISKYKKNTIGSDTENPVTRGIPTDIEEIEVDGIVLIHNHLIAHASTSVPASVDIVSLEGRLLMRTAISKRTDFNVPLDYSGLQPGFYIARVMVGNVRFEQKIFIK